MRLIRGGYLMRQARFIRFFSIAVSFALGTLGLQAQAADEQSVQNIIPAETQLTQSAEPPKAKTTVLMTQKLEGLPGFSVQIVLVEGPPGWVGGRHYHPGHVFVYMLDGTYQLNFDDLTSRTVLPGEVFYEAPNTIMRSKNGSSTEWVRDIVFQIIRDGQPAAVSVK